ncbi:aspartate aminotransferase family protein [Scopulibacillus cellulosilyticus]|uniref:Aspartate aminotransferase family protein n=1 Tax=Scopulibacillus cellulosilyticus TaxID=2665665 RepID=A0ABW2PVK5_9BACL
MANLSQGISKVDELKELDKKYYLHPTTVPKAFIENGPKIIFSEGNGIRVKDINGDTYIDGVSMLWNVNLGHGQKELADAARKQMTKLAYGSSFYGYSNEPAVRLAEKVVSLAPGHLSAIYYTSGGSESNDTAFKLARFYWHLKGKPNKKKIISISNSYHGATIGAGTATGIDAFHSFAGSKDSDVIHAKAHLTNCESGDKSDPNYEKSIRYTIEKEGSDAIAAVIMEPVQGAGGIHIAPDGYLKAVKNLCEENNILFIADEVICGFGRTGKMFGVENWDVVPDLMSVAKGITSGYSQLGGVLMSEEIRNTLVEYDQILGHGFTYSGHPTACAVGLKNLEIIERDHIVENVKNMEQELKKGFKYLEENHVNVTKTRALGLISGFDLQQDRDADIPFDQSIRAAQEVAEECYKRKLILRTADFEEGKNIIAIAPPLITTKEDIEEIINIIDEAITAFEKKIK